MFGPAVAAPVSLCLSLTKLLHVLNIDKLSTHKLTYYTVCTFYSSCACLPLSFLPLYHFIFSSLPPPPPTTSLLTPCRCFVSKKKKIIIIENTSTFAGDLT